MGGGGNLCGLSNINNNFLLLLFFDRNNLLFYFCVLLLLANCTIYFFSLKQYVCSCGTIINNESLAYSIPFFSLSFAFHIHSQSERKKQSFIHCKIRLFLLLFVCCNHCIMWNRSLRVSKYRLWGVKLVLRRICQTQILIKICIIRSLHIGFLSNSIYFTDFYSLYWVHALLLFLFIIFVCVLYD